MSAEDAQEAQEIATRERALASAGNRCFVCGKGNPIGLDVRFRLEETADGSVCCAEFTPGDNHAGYDKVTHGGIVFSLLDDVMANYFWLKGQQCFTARADIRYREQLPIGVDVRLEARLVKRKGRLAQMSGTVIRRDTNAVVAEANGSFMIVES